MKADIQYLIEKKDMIAVFDGLIEPALCDQLIAELKPIWNVIHREGQTAGGPMPLMKISQDATLSSSKLGDNWSESLGTIEKKIYEGLTAAQAWYRAEFEALHSWETIFDTGFQVQKYQQHNGFYRQHVDSLPSDPASCDRVLGCIIYLNTVYVGGETDFPMHEASIRPVSGRIALFPATFTHPHAGRPALSGDKWIISTFVCNEMTRQDPPVQTHVDHDAPHTHDDDTFSHPHDQRNSHTHDEYDEENTEEIRDGWEWV